MTLLDLSAPFLFRGRRRFYGSADLLHPPISESDSPSRRVAKGCNTGSCSRCCHFNGDLETKPSLTHSGCIKVPVFQMQDLLPCGGEGTVPRWRRADGRTDDCRRYLSCCQPSHAVLVDSHDQTSSPSQSGCPPSLPWAALGVQLMRFVFLMTLELQDATGSLEVFLWKDAVGLIPEPLKEGKIRELL